MFSASTMRAAENIYGDVACNEKKLHFKNKIQKLILNEI